MKLIMTLGLPASGKSTWAKELVAKSGGQIKRVNKDDLVKESYEETLKRKFKESNDKYEVLFKEKKSDDWSFCYRPNDYLGEKTGIINLLKKNIRKFLKCT